MDLSSTSEDCDPSRGHEKMDLSCFNQLLHTIGRLKFSLRSLQKIHTDAVFSAEEVDDFAGDMPSPVSNKILEDAMANVIVQNRGTCQGNIGTGFSESESLQRLQLVSKTLDEEVKRLRLHYITTLSKMSTPD